MRGTPVSLIRARVLLRRPVQAEEKQLFLSALLVPNASSIASFVSCSCGLRAIASVSVMRFFQLGILSAEQYSTQWE